MTDAMTFTTAPVLLGLIGCGNISDTYFNRAARSQRLRIHMAMALREGRPHRASGELALHVLEVLDAFGRSSADGRHVTMTTTAARPAPVPLGLDEAVLDAGQ